MSIPAGVARSLALALLVAAAAAQNVPAAPAGEGELRPLMRRQLLDSMSTLPEGTLAGLPGMTAESVSRIMKFRQGGKSFGSIQEFKSVSGLTEQQFQQLSANFRRPPRELDESEGLLDPSPERPPRTKAPAGGPGAAGGPARGQGSPSTQGASEAPSAGAAGGLNLEVRGHYYFDLPGYDLSVLSDEERRAFLDTINTEMCPCGCTGETLGYCLVNDPGCAVVKARVRKIYKDITGKEPVAKAGAARD